MNFRIEFGEDDVRGQMQRLVLPWLADASARIDTLIDWLHGYGLPPVGHDEEPYVWILRGLPIGGQAGEARAILTERVAELLERDMGGFGRRPNEVMYNLLRLAADLPMPETLGPALRKVCERREVLGNWRGFDLRGALLSALIYNQHDDGLRSDWKALLKGEKHGFLPASVEDAFHGILWMPLGPGKSGAPDLDAIGWALRQMADYLEKNRPVEYCDRFRHLLDEVRNTYPRDTWDYDLLMQADRHSFPRWAVQCLPDLCFASNNEQFIWKEIVRRIPEKLYTIVRTLCNNEVVVAIASSQQLPSLDTELRLVWRNVDAARRKHPFAAPLMPRTLAGMFNNTLAEVELCMGTAVPWVSERRAQILMDAGIATCRSRATSSSAPGSA
jgi:hypothetical protein